MRDISIASQVAVDKSDVERITPRSASEVEKSIIENLEMITMTLGEGQTKRDELYVRFRRVCVGGQRES